MVVPGLDAVACARDGRAPVYLDHAATTRVRSEVRLAMDDALDHAQGNPSSMHAAGRAARARLDDARDRLGAVLRGAPGGVVFTSGGSEADNLALRGVAASVGRPQHLVVTQVEHEAVLQTATALAATGWAVTVLPVDHWGRVDPERLAAALRPETQLVSIMLANNEVGTIQPVAELAQVVRSHSAALVHCDAVQALGRLEVDVDALDVDMVSLSAHKAYGPKGVGALWIRPGTQLIPQITGGLQERGYRAGTENVAGICGFGVAAELAEAERETEMPRQRRLAHRLGELIRAAVPDVVLTGAPGERRLAGFATFAFPEVAGDLLLIRLDRDGICASAGSACTSGAVHPSHVLTALGMTSELAAGGLRCTTGRGTDAAEIERAATSIVGAVRQLRAAPRLRPGVVGPSRPRGQTRSGSSSIAPQGHSTTQIPQPVQ
ncbi:MAG TPA: cysteine desulfurase family protein [Verrucomicrobiae bacterium]|nr:cysteine desulfurase family protein [Verrucomicrobiae bacterium]